MFIGFQRLVVQLMGGTLFQVPTLDIKHYQKSTIRMTMTGEVKPVKGAHKEVQE